VELVSAIRGMAMAGDVQAQQVLAKLLARDALDPPLRSGQRLPFPALEVTARKCVELPGIIALVVQDQEMMTAKACTGQATVAGYNTQTSDIPLFKRGEAKCHYKTYIWSRLHGSDVANRGEVRAMCATWVAANRADLEAYLFSPLKGEAARNGARREGRRTALTPRARARRPAGLPRRGWAGPAARTTAATAGSSTPPPSATGRGWSSRTPRPAG
jgi:hypothetical protein